MKRLRFLPVLLVVLGACSENLIVQNPTDSDEMGSVSIALSTDLRTEAVGTKAGDKPDINEFTVEIYKLPNKIRLYNDTFANTDGKPVQLNEGDYRLVVQHGDTLGWGFGKPYYLASPLFSITKEKRNVEVNAVAKLANVRIKVEYDTETINTEIYSDYKTIVRHTAYAEKKITFGKDERRYGYLPGGVLVLEFWAKEDGVWKTFESEPIEYKPNDSVLFTLTTDGSEGNLLVEIIVDNTVEQEDETVKIPAVTTPQPGPEIILNGFDGEGNAHSFVEGTEATGATASFTAKGALEHCYLTVDSDYLEGKGVPAEIDFADVPTDLAAKLKSLGFLWDENMATSRKPSYVDFSGVIRKMMSDIKAEAQDVEVAKFTLKVEDGAEKTAESSFSIISSTVNQTLTIHDYNVWAKRIVSPVVQADKGNMSKVKLQISTDGNSWSDLGTYQEKTEYRLTFANVTGLQPETTYKLRSIYNDNPVLVSPVVTLTTEEAAQLGNNGFEEWTEGQVKSYDIIGDTYQYTYYPWANGSADKWWDTNNAETTKTSGTPGYLEKKCFPMVSFMPGRNGGKAAQIMAIAVNGGNTNGTSLSDAVPGEIFIGTYGGTRNHSFSSRPDKMKFWFKYDIRTDDDHNSDTYRASVIIYNGTQEIGRGLLEYNTASDITSWTQASVDINYTVTDKAATAVYVQFLQTTNSKPVYNMNVSITYGNNRTAGVHGGSVLTIDDVELIYE